MEGNGVALLLFGFTIFNQGKGRLEFSLLVLFFFFFEEILQKGVEVQK